MAKDFNQPRALLEFLDDVVEESCRIDGAAVRFGIDGSLVVDGRFEGKPVQLGWHEAACGAAGEVAFRYGAIRPEPPTAARSERVAASRLARVIEQLADKSPPDLFAWRNRNLAEVYWGANLFERLCPTLVKPGRTRYFDYLLGAMTEYDGFLNLELSGPAEVALRIVPLQSVRALGLTPSATWGPFALVILRDARSAEQRALRAHRVEDFVGYVLARNAPAGIELRFERDDQPAGCLPSDLNVDFLHRGELDDTSFFHMVFASSDEIAVVTSCDRECLNLFSFLSCPVEEWSLTAPWQLRPSANLLGRMYHVPLSEQGMVMGDDLLGGCLDQIDAAPRPARLVVYVDSCINRLIGEDFRGSIRDFSRRSRLPVIAYEIDLKQEPYLAGLRGFFARLQGAVRRDTAPQRPGTVNLVGIGPDEGGELGSLLAAAGVSVVSWLCPQLSEPALARFGQAQLVVANEWDFVQQMLADLMAAEKLPVLSRPLPFGVQGTTDWVASICRELGLPEPDELPGRVQAARAIEQSRLRGVPIGIFGRASDIVEQLGARRRFGVPMVQVLTELGLQLELTLYAGRAVGGSEGEAILSGLGLSSAGGHSVRLYGDWRQIPELMRTGRSQLVYTETFRDERVTSAGKTPVTLRMFEPGYLGAERTVRALERALDTSFFRTWSRYLPDPYRNYRVGVGGNP